jgi:acyl carrier protein
VSQSDFIAQWSDALELEGVNDIAFEIPEGRWDSVAIITTIALVDEVYGKVLDGKALADIKTLSDLMTLIEKS